MSKIEGFTVTAASFLAIAEAAEKIAAEARIAAEYALEGETRTAIGTVCGFSQRSQDLATAIKGIQALELLAHQN